MSPISNATRLSDFGSGIGTQGAVLKVDNVNNRVGIGTTNPQALLQVGTGVSVYGNVGIVSATAFSGGWSGALSITDTTETTSTSTGALIVSGGVGIAKSLRVGTELHIGSNVTIGGTLTYEDVTNVDSVGLITAKSGVNITGGELTVGSGITMGIAGVATFSGTSDVHLLDNVKLLSGDGSDLQLYHNGSASFINNSTGNLSVQSSGNIWIENQAGSKVYIKALADAATEIYYNNSKKFETTNDGVVISGICTVDGLRLSDNESIKVGSGDDFEIKHDGSDSWIRDSGTGNLNIDSSTIQLRKYGAAETMAKFVQDAQVELYHNNIKTFETTGTGVTVSTPSGDAVFEISCAGQANLNLKSTSGTDHCSINFGDNADHDIGEIRYTNSSDQFSFDVGGTTNAIIVGPAGITTFTTTPHDDLGKLRDIPLRSVTGSAATLVLTDAGKVVSTNTTGWTVPALSWVAGNTVTLLNNSAGGLVITCSAVTTYLTSDGSTVTSKTLGARGLATLYFVSSSVAYLQGTALS